MSKQFYETRNLFRDATNYTKPLSYEDWMLTADDLKVGVLFVQFFDQITLAWYKLKTDAAVEEDCVSEVVKYLIKNAEIIKGNKNKFTPSYIYKIVYNCIYCKSIDPYKGQSAKNSWYNNTMSSRIYCEDTESEIDLFDSLQEEEDFSLPAISEGFWQLLEDADECTLSVVQFLLDGKAVPKKYKSEIETVIESLKITFEPFKEYFY